MALFDRFLNDIGVDLGTANSLIYLKDKGIIVNEPTVAAWNTKAQTILAVGEDAKKMLGRTPEHISVVRPLTSGVISDFEMTEEMLRQFLRKVNQGSLLGFRRAILAIPNELTEVERKSVEDAVRGAGCPHVYLVESPVAAALGAGLSIQEPQATLIVDIGGGTTDIAVISLGGTVVSKMLKVAGDRLNDDIIRYVRDEYKLMIGESTAELAKITAGSALPLNERLEVAIRGRDVASGLPREIMLKDTQIRAALHRSLRTIVDAVREIIERTPPELVGDMLQQGIHLVGGGALLRGLDELLERETGIPVTVAESPLTCVVRGLGRMVDDFDAHQIFLDNPLAPLAIGL